MDRWAGGVHLSIPFQLKMIARALSSYTSRRVALVLNGGLHGDLTLDAASWWPQCAGRQLDWVHRPPRVALRGRCRALRVALRVSAARDGVGWGGVGWFGWDGMAHIAGTSSDSCRSSSCPLGRCPTWPLSHLAAVPLGSFVHAGRARREDRADLRRRHRRTDRRLHRLVHGALHVACCMLSVACCMLLAAMLQAALPSACCMLLLQVACRVLHLACVICCACARWPRTACHMLHARRVQRWCGSDG